MRPDQEIGFMSAVAAREALGRGALSAEHYVGALLRRIERLDPLVRGFVSIPCDAALDAARQADRKRAAGRRLPPLHGLPFAVKDLIDVEGEPTSANSAAASLSPARVTAPAVRRLQRLGAIYIGKLTLEEFGIGSELDEAPGLRPKNPWDLDRSPGGSSSGSAVALAAGLLPLALGTDTTGSVRAPAAYCGVVGFRPTAGRVGRAGVHPLAPHLDTIGPMARTAADCGLLLKAMARKAPDHSPSALAIGRVELGDAAGRVVPAVQEQLDRALIDFASLGCTIVEAGALPLGAMRDSAGIILRREAFLVHRRRLEQGRPYRPATRTRLEAGAAIGTQDYREALASRRDFAAAVDRLLDSCDALALPVTFAAAPRAGDARASQLAGDVAFRAPFSLTGHPAIAFCTGFDECGLPLSMQLVGRRGGDEHLLSLVEDYQGATSWHEKRPEI
jgi:aspartyl-tRNA(Asn)/glutamyl-tRNA(Gln) amidotransferase subunit A